MSSVQNKSSLGDLGSSSLNARFELVYNQNESRYDGADLAKKLFSFKNTDQDTFRTTGLTGVPLLERFDEGDPIPKGVNTKTFETLYAVNDYGKGIDVTDDCQKDKQKLGAKLDEMANLARSTDIHQYKAAFQILNGGFVTTATVNGIALNRYNNEALFSASHARADGGTAQSNVSAAAISLTELNIETGRLALIKQLTDNGQPIVDMGAINLVVPDDLIKNAVIFTQSQYRATTANNDLNFYQTTTGKINVMSSRWLNANVGGSSTAWFLLATVPGVDSPLCVYRKGGPEFYAAPRDPNTWTQTFSVKNRMAIGNSEFKGTWASQGTGA